MKVYILTRGEEVTAWCTAASLCTHYGVKASALNKGLTRSNPCNIRGLGKVQRLTMQGKDNRGKFSSFTPKT